MISNDFFRDPINMTDWPLRSCLDMGYADVVSAQSVRSVLGYDPDGPIAVDNPICTSNANGIDDCLADETYFQCTPNFIMYLECQGPVKLGSPFGE